MNWTIFSFFYVLGATVTFALAGPMTIDEMVAGRVPSKRKWSRRWAEVALVVATIIWPLTLAAGLYEEWRKRGQG